MNNTQAHALYVNPHDAPRDYTSAEAKAWARGVEEGMRRVFGAMDADRSARARQALAGKPQ